MLASMDAAFAAAAARLIALGRAFDARGWAPATSGNYSARLADGRFAITASGRHKGRLVADDLLALGPDGRAAAGTPSAETGLHLALYAAFPETGAVLHSHSAVSVALMRRWREARAIRLEGYEMLKAFPGVTTHAAAVNVPIVENAQDMRLLAAEIGPRLLEPGAPPVYLIRDHGLYGWGRDIDEAERVVEAAEWMLGVEWMMEGR